MKRTTGFIRILKQDIEKYPEVKEYIRNYFYSPKGKLYDDDLWDEDSCIAEYKDCEALYGRFDKLENMLVSLHIPFDRYTDAYGDINSELLYYRPDKNNGHWVVADGSTGEFVYTEQELKKLAEGVAPSDFVTLGKRFKDFLEKIPDIPPLETYRR